MKPTILRMALALALTLGPAPAALAESVAVVLTNRFYDTLPDVPQARHVASLARDLRKAGFAVEVLRDFDSRDLQDGMAPILRRMDGADRLLILLSGHVLQSRRDAWLLARDAARLNAFAMGSAGVSIGALLDIAATRPGAAIVAIADSRGQLRPGAGLRDGYRAEDIPAGVAVLTGPPDRMARFVRRELLMPGQDLASAMRFAPEGVEVHGTPETLPLVPAELPGQAGVEQDLWQRSVAADTVEAYQDYLRRFPEGGHAQEARARLAQLQETPEQRARRIEDGIGLTRAQRRQIQADLKVLGHYTLSVDGLFGAGSRRAIANWQAQNGFAATGYLTANQVTLLGRQGAARAEEVRREAAARAAEEARADDAYWAETGAQGTVPGFRAYLDRYPEGRHADSARAGLQAIEAEARRAALAADEDGWAQAQAAGTIAAYDRYLARFPEGVHVEEARARIRALQAPAPPLPPAGPGQPPLPPGLQGPAADGEAALRLGPEARRLVELRLQMLGLQPGIPDGVFDPATRLAIRNYQISRGLPPTGYLDQLTLAQLVAEVVLR